MGVWEGLVFVGVVGVFQWTSRYTSEIFPHLQKHVIRYWFRSWNSQAHIPKDAKQTGKEIWWIKVNIVTLQAINEIFDV